MISKIFFIFICAHSIYGFIYKCGEEITVKKGEKRSIKFWGEEGELLKIDAANKKDNVEENILQNNEQKDENRNHPYIEIHKELLNNLRINVPKKAEKTNIETKEASSESHISYSNLNPLFIGKEKKESIGGDPTPADKEILKIIKEKETSQEEDPVLHLTLSKHESINGEDVEERFPPKGSNQLTNIVNMIKDQFQAPPPIEKQNEQLDVPYDISLNKIHIADTDDSESDKTLQEKDHEHQQAKTEVSLLEDNKVLIIHNNVPLVYSTDNISEKIKELKMKMEEESSDKESISISIGILENLKKQMDKDKISLQDISENLNKPSITGDSKPLKVADTVNIRISNEQKVNVGHQEHSLGDETPKLPIENAFDEAVKHDANKHAKNKGVDLPIISILKKPEFNDNQETTISDINDLETTTMQYKYRDDLDIDKKLQTTTNIPSIDLSDLTDEQKDITTSYDIHSDYNINTEPTNFETTTQESPLIDISSKFPNVNSIDKSLTDEKFEGNVITENIFRNEEPYTTTNMQNDIEKFTTESSYTMYEPLTNENITEIYSETVQTTEQSINNITSSFKQEENLSKNEIKLSLNEDIIALIASQLGTDSSNEALPEGTIETSFPVQDSKNVKETNETYVESTTQLFESQTLAKSLFEETTSPFSEQSENEQEMDPTNLDYTTIEPKEFTTEIFNDNDVTTFDYKVEAKGNDLGIEILPSIRVKPQLIDVKPELFEERNVIKTMRNSDSLQSLFNEEYPNTADAEPEPEPEPNYTTEQTPNTSQEILLSDDLLDYLLREVFSPENEDANETVSTTDSIKQAMDEASNTASKSKPLINFDTINNENDLTEPVNQDYTTVRYSEVENEVATSPIINDINNSILRTDNQNLPLFESNTEYFENDLTTAEATTQTNILPNKADVVHHNQKNEPEASEDNFANQNIEQISKLDNTKASEVDPNVNSQYENIDSLIDNFFFNVQPEAISDDIVPFDYDVAPPFSNPTNNADENGNINAYFSNTDGFSQHDNNKGSVILSVLPQGSKTTENISVKKDPVDSYVIEEESIKTDSIHSDVSSQGQNFHSSANNVHFDTMGSVKSPNQINAQNDNENSNKKDDDLKDIFSINNDNLNYKDGPFIPESVKEYIQREDSLNIIPFDFISLPSNPENPHQNRDNTIIIQELGSKVAINKPNTPPKETNPLLESHNLQIQSSEILRDSENIENNSNGLNPVYEDSKILVNSNAPNQVQENGEHVLANANIYYVPVLPQADVKIANDPTKMHDGNLPDYDNAQENSFANDFINLNSQKGLFSSNVDGADKSGINVVFTNEAVSNNGNDQLPTAVQYDSELEDTFKYAQTNDDNIESKVVGIISDNEPVKTVLVQDVGSIIKSEGESTNDNTNSDNNNIVVGINVDNESVHPVHHDLKHDESKLSPDDIYIQENFDNIPAFNENSDSLDTIVIEGIDKPETSGHNTNIGVYENDHVNILENNENDKNYNNIPLEFDIFHQLGHTYSESNDPVDNNKKDDNQYTTNEPGIPKQITTQGSIRETISDLDVDYADLLPLSIIGSLNENTYTSNTDTELPEKTEENIIKDLHKDNIYIENDQQSFPDKVSFNEEENKPSDNIRPYSQDVVSAAFDDILIPDIEVLETDSLDDALVPSDFDNIISDPTYKGSIVGSPFPVEELDTAPQEREPEPILDDLPQQNKEKQDSIIDMIKDFIFSVPQYSTAQKTSGDENIINTQDVKSNRENHDLAAQNIQPVYNENNNSPPLPVLNEPPIYTDNIPQADESFYVTDERLPLLSDNFQTRKGLVDEAQIKSSRRDDSANYGGDNPFFIKLPGGPNAVPVFLQYEPVQVKYVPADKEQKSSIDPELLSRYNNNNTGIINEVDADDKIKYDEDLDPFFIMDAPNLYDRVKEADANRNDAVVNEDQSDVSIQIGGKLNLSGKQDKKEILYPGQSDDVPVYSSIDTESLTNPIFSLGSQLSTPTRDPNPQYTPFPITTNPPKTTEQIKITEGNNLGPVAEADYNEGTKKTPSTIYSPPPSITFSETTTASYRENQERIEKETRENTEAAALKSPYSTNSLIPEGDNFDIVALANFLHQNQKVWSETKPVALPSSNNWRSTSWTSGGKTYSSPSNPWIRSGPNSEGYSAFYSPEEIPGIDPSYYSYKKPLPLTRATRHREKRAIDVKSLKKYIDGLPLPMKQAVLSPENRRKKRHAFLGENINCEWNIKSEPGQFLLVTFHNLSAAYSVNCEGAYIEVERENNGFDARWCGNRVSMDRSRSHVIFAKSQVRIAIFDDGDTTKLLPTGFEADVEALDLMENDEYAALASSNARRHTRRLRNRKRVS